MQRSTSALTSARALSRAGAVRTSFGLVADERASQAAMTLNAAVLLGAFMRETTSLSVFFVCSLKVEVMSGKGGAHLRVLPRSPCVPTTQSQGLGDSVAVTSGCRALQMV